MTELAQWAESVKNKSTNSFLGSIKLCFHDFLAPSLRCAALPCGKFVLTGAVSWFWSVGTRLVGSDILADFKPYPKTSS